MRKFITWHTLHTEHGAGSWAIIDDMLTVRTANGTKTAVIGSMVPIVLARILMRELSQDREDAVPEGMRGLLAGRTSGGPRSCLHRGGP